MQVRESVEDGLHILHLSGEIDMHHSPELREILGAHADARRPSLLVDFTAVEYIDSSGLATLVEYVQKTVTYGGKLALGGVNDRIRTVFNLVRLGEIFPIHGTIDEARTALRSPPA